MTVRQRIKIGQRGKNRALVIFTIPIWASGGTRGSNQVGKKFFHLKPAHSPYLIAASLPEAAAWSAHRLDEAGLHPAAERVRHRFGLGPSQQTGS